MQHPPAREDRVIKQGGGMKASCDDLDVLLSSSASTCGVCSPTCHRYSVFDSSSTSYLKHQLPQPPLIRSKSLQRHQSYLLAMLNNEMADTSRANGHQSEMQMAAAHSAAKQLPTAKQRVHSYSEHHTRHHTHPHHPTQCYEHLPPENDASGNIEYKSTLVSPSPSRLQHLSTQMKWRLQEGGGEALYEIGVGDDGSLIGLSEPEMHASLETLGKMADAIDASVTILNRRYVQPHSPLPTTPLANGNCLPAVSSRSEEVSDAPTGINQEPVLEVVEALVRRRPDTRDLLDLRLAILGAAESGKSTLCGVLTQGVLDNGQGKARLNLFRYLHEFRSGKTSSVCLDLVGFSQSGELINYADHSLEEVVELSSHLLTLIDLAGDKKYMRTTIYGVSGYNPHYCALLVNARQGPTEVTREHLGLALALQIPLFVLLTKVDLVNDAQLERVFQAVEQMIEGMQDKGLRTVRVVDEQSACRTLEFFSSAPAMVSRSLIPMLAISNVNGTHLELLYTLLSHLPSCELHPFNRQPIHLSTSGLPLFYVEEVFRRSDAPAAGFVVVCGILAQGRLHEGEEIKLGPTGHAGRYLVGKVESIHRNRQPVTRVCAGQTASLALSLASLSSNQSYSLVRRGMVVISMDDEGQCCTRFVARFCLLYHPASEISIGFQGTVYIGSLCRTATVVNFEGEAIKPCRWCCITFEFHGQRPEFVKVGMPLIFRECMTKGTGEVVEIVPFLPTRGPASEDDDRIAIANDNSTVSAGGEATSCNSLDQINGTSAHR